MSETKVWNLLACVRPGFFGMSQQVGYRRINEVADPGICVWPVLVVLQLAGVVTAHGVHGSDNCFPLLCDQRQSFFPPVKVRYRRAINMVRSRVHLPQ